jgi:hypothetical protein
MNDPSNEIRGRLSAVISRLQVLAHSTGPLVADDVTSALTLVEHEVSHIMAAVARLPKGGQP